MNDPELRRSPAEAGGQAAATHDRLAAALAHRYRVERELGVGGMATVYLAHDEKHARHVAIKVLKPELAAVLGAERFVQEIKTTASLSHPHILPLFESGEAGGFLYYVMPFIEGETIRDRLNRETQLGVDEAVRIAREVADALDYAHRRGVIHRDIKPENILLHDGRAMVMDFGIALAVSAAAGGRMTETGLSLGTPHYMSPEQATAEKQITSRSDVYSLASVLYEMLAGQPPHLGGPAQQVIMKIITERAQPVRELRRSVPPNVEAALATALEKLPADRFESAKAFADALANAAFVAGPALAATVGARRDRRMLIGAIAVAVAGLAGGWALGRGHARTPSALNLSIFLPDSTLLDPTSKWREGLPALAIAPDGSTIVFVGRKGRTSQLYLRRLSSFDVRALDGTDGAYAPFFSPNGDEVAFFVDTRLMRVALADGHTTQVATGFEWPIGGSWTRDGRFLISSLRARGTITVLGANGDPLQEVRCLGTCSMPNLLPDGRHMLVSRSDRISVVDLQDESERPLQGWNRTSRDGVLSGSMASYDGDGHVVWVSLGGDIMAAPFDADGRALTGPASILAQGAQVESGRGAAQFALSTDGTIAFAPGPLRSVGILVMSDRAGHLDTLKAPAANYNGLELAPDGRRVLAKSSASDGQSSIVVVDAATGRVTPWVTTAERIADLRWDIDGRHAWYRVAQTAYRGDPDVTTAPESLALAPRSGFMPLPDGKRFLSYSGDTLFVQRLDGAPAEISMKGRQATGGVVTDDSRWVVQHLGGTGDGTGGGIEARALDSSARRLVISNSPDFGNLSSTPGAGEIFVSGLDRSSVSSPGRAADEQLFWSIPYTPGNAAPFGQPRLLFRANAADFQGRNYSVGLRGQRFVFKQHLGVPQPREIRLVKHWHSVLAATGRTTTR